MTDTSTPAGVTLEDLLEAGKYILKQLPPTSKVRTTLHNEPNGKVEMVITMPISQALLEKATGKKYA